MIVNIEIPDYEYDGLDVIWEDNAHYKLFIYKQSVHLVANTEGLMSLAKQMIYLAVNDVPEGSHVHFDKFFTKMNDLPIEFVVAKE